MKKIVVFGSESTGKTTLALALANYFGVPYCPEYVRYYLELRNQSAERKGIVSVYDDITPMAIGQLALENSTIEIAKGLGSFLVIFDTNVEINWLYSRYYFDQSPLFLDEIIKNNDKYDFYLLLAPTVAWQADGLRDSPHNRLEMHQLFKNFLVKHNKKFAEVTALQAERTKQAIQLIKKIVF